MLCELQVQGLEAAVDSKDAELITLRKTLEHKEAQVRACTPVQQGLCASIHVPHS